VVHFLLFLPFFSSSKEMPRFFHTEGIAVWKKIAEENVLGKSVTIISLPTLPGAKGGSSARSEVLYKSDTV
jgi:hypothetical protein